MDYYLYKGSIALGNIIIHTIWQHPRVVPRWRGARLRVAVCGGHVPFLFAGFRYTQGVHVSPKMSAVAWRNLQAHRRFLYWVQKVNRSCYIPGRPCVTQNVRCCVTPFARSSLIPFLGATGEQVKKWNRERCRRIQVRLSYPPGENKWAEGRLRS